MDDLFAGTNVAYEIGEKKIYLKAKEAPAASQGSQKTKKITGTVTDTKGEPVIGASVLVKGAGTGTVTDVDGNFTLDAPTDALLAVSYIGYKTQEVKVGNKTHILSNCRTTPKYCGSRSSWLRRAEEIRSDRCRCIPSLLRKSANRYHLMLLQAYRGVSAGVDIVQQAGVAGQM